MFEKINDMYKPITDLDDIVTKMECSRACCNLALESFQDELKHLPDGGGWLSEVLLTLYLATDAYFDAEKALNDTSEKMLTIYKQLRESVPKNA